MRQNQRTKLRESPAAFAFEGFREYQPVPQSFAILHVSLISIAVARNYIEFLASSSAESNTYTTTAFATGTLRCNQPSVPRKTKTFSNIEINDAASVVL
jgi:hypothetical protein